MELVLSIAFIGAVFYAGYCYGRIDQKLKHEIEMSEFRTKLLAAMLKKEPIKDGEKSEVNQDAPI